MFTRTLLPLLLAAPLAAAGQVHVVAPVAGPGVDFTNLQTALNAAANGDVVLLRTGNYSAFSNLSFSGKGLTIVEDAGHTAVLATSLTISNIAAGQMVCLRNVDILAPDAGAALVLQNSPGAIWVEGATLTATSMTFPFLPTGEGARVTNCADVVIARCTLTGATPSPIASTGYAGLASNTSNVALYDSTSKGGNGVGGSPLLVGGAGATQNGGFLHAAGTSFIGGKGSNGAITPPFGICTNGANGGPGLHLTTNAPSASTLACTFTGGAGGTAPPATTCTAGAAGSGLKIDSGTHTPLAGPSHSLVCSPTCREGQTFALTYTGVPGELVFIDFGGFQGFTYFPDFRGVLVLGFPLFTLFHGTLPASGTLAKTSGVIQDLGVSTEGVTLYLQSAFYSLSDGLYQAAPSATVLLDAGL